MAAVVYAVLGLGGAVNLGESDTIGDFVADACGATAGGVLLVIWAAFGWRSVRRVRA